MALIKGTYIDSMQIDKTKKGKPNYDSLEYHKELRTANPVDKAMLENDKLLDKKIVTREEKQKFNDNMTLLKTASVYEKQKGTGETLVSDYLKKMPQQTKGYNTAEYWREMRSSDPVEATLFDTHSLLGEGVLTTDEKKRLEKNINTLQQKRREQAVPENIRGMIDQVMKKAFKPDFKNEEDEQNEHVAAVGEEDGDNDTAWGPKLEMPDFESRFYRREPHGEDIDPGFSKKSPYPGNIDPGFEKRLPRAIDGKHPLPGYQPDDTEDDNEDEKDAYVRSPGQRPGSFEEREYEQQQKTAGNLTGGQAAAQAGRAAAKGSSTSSYPLTMSGLHQLEHDEEQQAQSSQQNAAKQNTQQGKQQTSQQGTQQNAQKPAQQPSNTSQAAPPKQGESFGQYDRRVTQESELQDDLDKYGGVFYSQVNEKDWSDYEYGAYNIKGSGCGPTAAAMVVATLTGQEVTPLEAAKYAQAHDGYEKGVGTKNDFAMNYAKANGLNAQNYPTSDKNIDRLSDAFEGENKTMAVVGVHPGSIWRNGHFVTVTGKTTVGYQEYFIVYDPNYDKAANKNKDGTSKQGGSVYYKNGIKMTDQRGVILVPYDVLKADMGNCTIVTGNKPYANGAQSGAPAPNNTPNAKAGTATGTAPNGAKAAPAQGQSNTQQQSQPTMAGLHMIEQQTKKADEAAVAKLPDDVQKALATAQSLMSKSSITAADQKAYQNALQTLQLYSPAEKIGYKAGTPTPVMSFLNAAPKSIESKSSSIASGNANTANTQKSSVQPAGNGTKSPSNSGAAVSSQNSNARQYSSSGVNFLKRAEGFATSHENGLDKGNATIGYGFVDNDGTYKDGMKETDADKLLKEKMSGSYSKNLNKFLNDNHISVSQNQYDALLSFTYNLGQNIWTKDSSFRQLLISGKYSDADVIKAFTAYSKYTDDGEKKFAPGLWKRRMNEALLFLKGDYSYYELGQLKKMGYTY